MPRDAAQVAWQEGALSFLASGQRALSLASACRPEATVTCIHSVLGKSSRCAASFQPTRLKPSPCHNRRLMVAFANSQVRRA